MTILNKTNVTLRINGTLVLPNDIFEASTVSSQILVIHSAPNIGQVMIYNSYGQNNIQCTGKLIAHEMDVVNGNKNKVIEIQVLY